MQTLEEFLSRNPRFECPAQFCLAGPLGRSLICFHNFYGQIFKNQDVPVDLHIFSFDSAGRQVGSRTLALATGAAVQVPESDLNMVQPGLVSVAALPRFDMEALAAGRLTLKKRIGTGFYVIWKDLAGHVDTMHEWLPVTAHALPAQVHHVVFDHMGGRIARYGLVLMSPVADRGQEGRARLTAYTKTGRSLASVEAPSLPAMGSRIVYLDEVFPEFAGWVASEGYLGVRIESRNMVEPFSVEIHRSGDFHLHHIN